MKEERNLHVRSWGVASIPTGNEVHYMNDGRGLNHHLQLTQSRSQITSIYTPEPLYSLFGGSRETPSLN